MTFVPNNVSEAASKGKGSMSPLLAFRSSPVYKALKKKRDSIGKLLVQSADQIPSNLQEEAEEWLANQDKMVSDFPSAVMAKLVDIGLDRALLEVEDNGNNISVYFNDRLGKLYKEIPSFLSRIAEVELQSQPEDNGQGMYIFAMQANPDVDFTTYMRALMAQSGSSGKMESVDPYFKRGK